MPIEPFQLVEDYGEAVLLGNAALFIGAGISQGAGLPGWGALLDPIRVGCNVPEHHDLPLVAEYIVNEATDGRQAIEDHILAELSKTSMRPARSHRLISLLALREVWTTNYDPLIEKAMAAADIDVAVAFDENTTRAIASNHARTVIKMHGSINTELKWDAPPIITRTDYEQYESQHPRMWTVLRASYLSRSMLFMGFSFTDPNVDILLRLARTLGTAGGDRHYAVMKCPGPGDPDDEKRLHALRTADLEQSGVSVCEIDDYDQNTELLTQLLRRTRPARIFISGSTGLKGKTTSEEDERLLGDWTLAIARQLAPRTDWEIASLGGPAGWLTSRDVARLRRLDGSYDPAALTFHFRHKNEPPAPLEERVGTAIYTDLDRDRLVISILDECRALLVIRGGDRTTEEIDWATVRAVGVVPLACTGGAAQQYWADNRSAPPDLGGRPTDPATWENLNTADPDLAAEAAYQLLKQAMYEVS